MKHLEDKEEYSVFREVRRKRPEGKMTRIQRIIYFLSAGYFLIHGLLRWIYFFALRNRSLALGEEALNSVTGPYLLSAISTTLILTSSLVLFFRKSVRASVALFILGAVLELIFAYFIVPAS